MHYYTIAWHDIISIIGVAIILVTYFLLQWGKLSVQTYTYSILNIVGSLMILYSLFYAWNLGAAIIEIFWAFISAVGLVKQLIKRRQ